MIRTIAVQGYRSVRDLRLELDGCDVVTGANGAGKSNLYRALRLLAGCADGSVVGAIARDGGLGSLLWAGMERPTQDVRAGHSPAQGTIRREPIGLRLGFASEGLGYLVDLGIPPPGHSPFVNDPEIKREQIFHGALARPASLLVDRRGASIRVRDGAWRTLDWQVLPHRSVLAEAAGVEDAPEIVSVRDRIRSWRFYDHFRTDPEAPARQSCVGTVSPVLDADGANLAASLATIEFQGDRDGVARAVQDAFPGSSLTLDTLDDGLVRVLLRQPGLLRPLGLGEVSDGTLRYLLLVAALKTTRPPGLMVLNEPETSLHRDLLPALAALVAETAATTQVIVVTHAADLIGELTSRGARRHELIKDAGGTSVAGAGGLLDGARWSWPTR